ncbi:MAG: PEGA domain-containing protein [Spirochaetia bacterium]
MPVKKPVFFILFLFLLLPSAYSQESVSLALLPLNPVGITEMEGRILTGLLESAFIQTGSYQLASQSRTTEALRAEGFSAADCSHPGNAAEVGRSLGTEQVMYGEVTRLSGRILLHGEIINAESGEVIREENTETATVDEMMDAVELLAFKIAGMIVLSGLDNEGHEIAESFTEIVIRTQPSGARVFLNSREIGTGPFNYRRVPVGRVRIDAAYENMHFSRVMEIAETTNELLLELEQRSGSIYIRTENENVGVSIDGNDLGPIGDGYYHGLTGGEHRIELFGRWVYWTGFATVIPGETVRIDAVPATAGQLTYSLPDGAAARLYGRGENITFHGTDSTLLIPGRYQVSVTGEDYQQYNTSIRIIAREETRFHPEMEFSSAYYQERFDNMLEGLSSIETSGDFLSQVFSIRYSLDNSPFPFPAFAQQLLDVTENRLISYFSTQEISSLENSVLEQKLENAQAWEQRIVSGHLDIPDASSQIAAFQELAVEEYRTRRLRMEAARLEEELALINADLAAQDAYSVVFWSGIGTAAAGAVSAGVSYGFGNTPGNAQMAAHWRYGFYAGTAAAALGVLVSSITHFAAPDTENAEERVEEIRARIEALEAELQ